MALRKKARTIPISDIRSGQVLEIGYDGDTDLILVIDPNAKETSSTSQGRPNKLHAIKLANFVDSDLVNLISEIRSTGTSRGTVTNYDPYTLYKKFISSRYSGRRSYRTYTPSKITNAMRITVGQDAPGTNKIQIGNSVLYGVEHGRYVQISVDDYDVLEMELNRLNNQTFYEGPEGHEPVTKEVIMSVIGGQLIGKSWEPPEKGFTEYASLGNAVAGWWNQTLDEAVGLDNIKAVWTKSGVSFNATIGQAFTTSIGSTQLQTIIDNFTDYSGFGRYSTADFLSTLNKRGFDKSGNPTDALYDFNQAGHDQVFPEDNSLPEGPLKATEQAFNRYRDEYLIKKMRTDNGIYFAGSGHLDNIRKMM